MDATNEILAKGQDRPGVEFLDINSRFLDKDGELKEGLFHDGLHLSTDGYRVWAEAIEPAIRRGLGEEPGARPGPAPGEDRASEKQSSRVNPVRERWIVNVSSSEAAPAKKDSDK